VALSAVAVGVYHRIDQVMLHKMTGDITLGPYVVAVQMAELFSALPVALMSSLFPILSRTAHQEEQFRHYLGVSYRFLMAVVFFVCAILIPITAPLVNLFYGKEFQSSAGLLIVLIWSEVPVFFGVVLTSAVMAKGLQRYLPVSTAVGALMNIVLNFLFIPRWGALGSSWATVMSYTGAALFFIAFRPTRSLTLQGVRLALRPLALVLGITVVLQFLPWVFWWKFVAACACYVAGAWAMGIVLHSELRRVWELIRSNSLLFGCNQPLAISYPLRKAPGDRKD
jgi:PST family polysaccharide transporter